MPEYLGAILRQGEARLPDVKHRLLRQARERGIDLERPNQSLDDALRTALDIGARVAVEESGNQRLAEQEPGRADYLRDLSVSYERMGEMLQSQGQGERARELLQKSLEIRERLAEQEQKRLDREERLMSENRRWLAILEEKLEHDEDEP